MKQMIIIIAVIISIAISGFLVYRIGFYEPKAVPEPEATPMPIDESAEDWQGSQKLPQVKGEQEFIAIPGFDSLVFEAGKTIQQVNFYNPKENTCLFTMSLIIDGEELWKSGNVEAGKGFYEIVLSHALESGTYQGIQHIDCYTVDGAQLNSANVEFTLIVQ